METRNHAAVEVETESGVIGYGEVSPAPAFIGGARVSLRKGLRK